MNAKTEKMPFMFDNTEQLGIQVIDFYVPENCISNQELSQKVDSSDEWIVSHTGIHQRHIASKEQASSDLGAKAAEKVLLRAGLTAENIDLIIVSSSAPDYYGFPSTACVIQHQLSCSQAAAFDIKAACSGFVYGLQIGKSMMLADKQYQNVLLISAEKLSAITNWSDRSTAVLLGDGAGAVLLSRQSGNSKIIDSVLRSDGKGAKALLVPDGGSRNPIVPSVPLDIQDNITAATPTMRNKLEMDGRAVYNFAVQANQDIIQILLQRNNLCLDEIAYIVPHQANERIIQAVAKRKNIPLERFYLNIASYANTSSASIPIALCEMQEKHILNKGDLVLTVGFGSGLTYGGNLIRW